MKCRASSRFSSQWESVGFWRVWKWRFWIGMLGWVCMAITGSTPGYAGPVPDLVFVQIPNQTESSPLPKNKLALPASRYVNGMRIVRYSPDESKPTIKILTPDFESACDPAISFDGSSILFAGKKSSNSTWQIWRMDRDGGNLTQITHSPGDCISPLYVGTLFHLDDNAPTNQIVYACNESGWIDPSGEGTSFALFCASLDGSQPTRISYNLGSDFDPDVLPNGRVVYTRGLRIDNERRTAGTYDFMEINNDGTDMLPFYQNSALPPNEPAIKGMLHIAPQHGRAYFIEANESSWLGEGRIAYVSLRRPLHSYAILSSTETGTYASPCSISEKGFIASYRNRNASDSCFGLFHIDPLTGERREELYAEPGWHCLDTQVLAPHPPVKGRSTVVNLQEKTGAFYCLDISISDRPEIYSLPKGTIKQVRVLEGLPLLSTLPRTLISHTIPFAGEGSNQYSGTPFAARRIVGTAPVEEDGSFHVEVPAHIPLSLQLLDERSMTVAEQNSWTWVLPHENRGCIGCHEDRELSPPNRLVKAVINKARSLTLPPQQRRMVDFIHDVKPILETNCSGMKCHSAGKVEPDLDVHRLVEHPGYGAFFVTAYENLLSPIPGRENDRYVIPGNAKESPLIWNLHGEYIGDSEKKVPFSHPVQSMPPGQSLSDLDKTILIEWIDLGALYDIRPVAQVVDSLQEKQEE